MSEIMELQPLEQALGQTEALLVTTAEQRLQRGEYSEAFELWLQIATVLLQPDRSTAAYNALCLGQFLDRDTTGLRSIVREPGAYAHIEDLIDSL